MTAAFSVRPPAPAARLANVASSPVRDLLALTSRPEVIAFSGGLPAPEFFDTAGLAAAFDHVLRHDGQRALQYSPTEGDLALRTAIAARAPMPTDPADVLVTTGSQQALTLVATALVSPGDTVLVEAPAYLAAIQCLQLAGARLVPVPGDDDGIDVDALVSLIREEKPKLLYLVPTFQNPTGRTITATRRRAIAEAASREGIWIVEDDPYAELRYDGTTLAPIAAEPAAADRTILLGSFSKILAPGLRLGWLRAPAPLRSALVIAKQAADLHTSTIDQAAAAHYLAHTDLASHLDHVRAAYRSRRDAMQATLPEVLPAGSRWTSPSGGMFVWVRLPDGFNATELLPAALARDVAYVPGVPFYVRDPDVRTLRLSFTTHSPERTIEGLRRLSGVFG
ncbi:PLP-dependent aminotransferase family protein [Fodinicola acaciae]|uniref:aminotransferase-like domain-containing protein n=1 Tax=Fodinicola acaciae TaxID=2681555 RepID=UPI0013D13C6E|nr:PLP-dependent aminotransferase family protein [Fodinicola acaciae]